jgi:hypothetical protein
VSRDIVAIRHETSGGHRMDIFYIAMAVAFFGLSWLLVVLCDRL